MWIDEFPLRYLDSYYFDVISDRVLDINTNVFLRLQSQRDRKTAATVGVLRVPPEKPRPPRAV